MRDDREASEVADRETFDPDSRDAIAADDREAAHSHAPTRIGRVDLTITWRRTVRVADPRADGAVHAIASPLDPVTTARGVLWLLLTWRR